MVALRASQQLPGVFDAIGHEAGLAREPDVEQAHRRVLPSLYEQRTCPTRADRLQLGLVARRVRGEERSRIGEAQGRERACGQAGACQHRAPAKACLAGGLSSRSVLLGKAQERGCAENQKWL